jgi:hypothetical protein
MNISEKDFSFDSILFFSLAFGKDNKLKFQGRKLTLFKISLRFEPIA